MNAVTEKSPVAEDPVDKGTGYGLAKPTFDTKLTAVGPGTPMGETLRRYWHPVALSSQATHIPRKVRLLCEDLILFRDGAGRPGLLAQNCCHRGSNLFYGRVEPDGLRCCYHGWKFDVKGRCLEQPCEPQGGVRRDVARQPWYPVQERYGLVWAYMGRPEKKPALPRWSGLEIPEGSTDQIEIRLSPGWGDADGIMDFNWMHCYENGMDPFHVAWLHIQHSGPQFVFESDTNRPEIAQNLMKGTRYVESRWGVAHKTDVMTVEMIFPCSSIVPGFNDLMVHVPVDDNKTRMIQLTRLRADQAGATRERQLSHNGKSWDECTPEERQKYPGDSEAMQDIPGSGHSWEHLATTDRGIVLMRRVWEREVDKVLRGEDPLGVSYSESEGPRQSEAGVFLR